MYPEIERRNARVLALDDSNPAKRFLCAFLDCRENCAGRELDLGGQVPIDQAWASGTDGRVWKFSDFVYTFLCYTIELDGILTDALSLTASETAARNQIPKLHTMMAECAQAARESGNNEILKLTDQVRQMLDLWEQYIAHREQTTSRATG
jgi:hypothetical protein